MPLIPAVIAGFENNGLGVARALAAEGIPSIALAGPHWTYSCCSWRSKVVMSKAWSADAVVSELCEIGRRLEGRTPLLITKDEPVLWVSDHREELSRYFHISMPDREAVLTLMDKTLFQNLALERGWPVPRTWHAYNKADLLACSAEAVYPCILKPAIKNSVFRQNSPRKAFKAASAEELVRVYELVSAWEPEVLVQEWIEGGDDRVTFGLGYWNSRSEAIAIFPGQKLRQWPPECGNTAIAAPAPPEWRDQLSRLTDAVLSSVGYRGLGSVEFKMRPSGEPVIMEPTVGRTNYQNEIAVLNGVNLPAMAYFDMMGMSEQLAAVSEPGRRTHAPVKLVDSVPDYKSARIYMSAGKLTWRGWIESRSGPKKYFLYRASDPAPFVCSVARGALSWVKHKVVVPVIRGFRQPRETA